MCSYLRQCLKSVYQAGDSVSFEVIVVDNYSHDNSCHMILQEFPKVKLIRNKGNSGFSKAVNQGLEKARGEYICLLNPDTLISDDTFEILLDYLTKHSSVGCIGPKILNPDGGLQLACKRSFPSPFTALSKMTGLSRLFPGSRLFGRYIWSAICDWHSSITSTYAPTA